MNLPHLLIPDWLALSGYLVLTLAIGAWASRRHAGSDELFLAGRSLGPLAVGFSLFASNVSSDTIIGLPGAAYATGISAANYEWMASVVLVVSLVAVYPVLARARVSTMPELLQRRFDRRMRTYLSVVTLFLSVVLDTSGTLYAGALVLTTFIGHFALWQATLAIALFTAGYTAAGGLRAVVYTDVMQALVLLVGASVLAWIVFGQYGHSWSAVLARVPHSHLSLIRPPGDPGVPWPGLLTGLPVVGFYYWTMNQYIAQRVLGARDLASSSRGALLAALLKLAPLFIMTLPGAMAIGLLPHLRNADDVWPQLVVRYAPHGLLGLILAALLAALMSTCSATLNSAATLVTLDFVQPARPQWDSRQLARCGRLFTLATAVAAALWAPQIAHFQGLWAYLQQVFAYIASPLVATFVLGLALPRLGPAAALRGLGCGHAVALALFAAGEAGWLSIHFTVVGGVLFVATALLTLGWMAWLGERDRLAADSAAARLVERNGLPRLPRDVWALALAVLGGVALLLWAFA